MHFRLYALRLIFLARTAVTFPPGAASNRLRGAFGAILHKLGRAGIFEPSSEAGPSGLRDHPRPFVFRARHLDGTAVAPGETFHFDFHWFDLRRSSLDMVIRAFGALIPEAELVDVQGGEVPLELSLNPSGDPVHRLTIGFETPTELKSGGVGIERPEFGVLAARVRDRISTLRALYGDGPLTIDFREFGQRAEHVKITRCNIHRVETSRRSSRTGQTHSLGGFIGEAEYEGDLTEFMPYLRAAQWTGVGRQTAWGKGALVVTNTEETAPVKVGPNPLVQTLSTMYTERLEK